MIYYHLLTQKDAREAIKLPNSVFQKTYSRPENCGFEGALDKQFGCPFLFRSDKDRVSINQRCKNCTCGKLKK